MSKPVVAALTIAIATALAIAMLSSGNGPIAHAQAPTSSIVIAATSNGAASTVWIVDAGRRNVVLCRQSVPSATSEEALQFGCKAQPLP